MMACLPCRVHGKLSKLGASLGAGRVSAAFSICRPSKECLMEEFGEAVSAAEKVGGPWKQPRPQATLSSAEPQPVTHKLPPTVQRAGALGTRHSCPLAQDFLAQPDPGPWHTKTWRGTGARGALSGPPLQPEDYLQKMSIGGAFIYSINKLLPG